MCGRKRRFEVSDATVVLRQLSLGCLQLLGDDFGLGSERRVLADDSRVTLSERAVLVLKSIVGALQFGERALNSCQFGRLRLRGGLGIRQLLTRFVKAVLELRNLPTCLLVRLAQLLRVVLRALEL